MSCKCAQPKRLPNSAGGVNFVVCAKSLGGCGEEIIQDNRVRIVGNWITKPKEEVFDIKFVGNDFTIETSFPTGPCEYNCCGKPGIRQRQNTQYIEDERNFGTFCEEHQEEVDAYWDEMWKDYWSGRL